jgi:ribosomal protein S18 acetylase RimI-like enzyme
MREWDTERMDILQNVDINLADGMIWSGWRNSLESIRKILCKVRQYMIIRNATIEDLDMITAVESECFPPAEAATKESIKKRLEVYSSHFWLLLEEDQLISFVNGMVTDEENLRDEMYEDASMHNEDGKWQMIFGVDTIPSHRRQGYAEKCSGEP